ncbi:GDP-fucose transporter-related protein [Tritrichomonas foetus]|uniref:GDP-fucose transporter-related protein n=1 Tax=Tritrichomonas foetus TaxID=1144522 RepID=A0A1J4JZM8_9EUKA|nr:GDP-fucose transporter-related protein [Tritrichomonas foetus]|eukprot:OHT04138.1 GDP-fucose transporter-related protein [Tritrichomonas foetus]
MLDSKAELRKQTIQSALAVTFYMTVSIGLVFLNRLVLTDKTEKAGALFVSWYQFVVAYVIIVIITTFCPNVPLLNLFPPLKYQWSVVVKVLPVSFTYLLMIGFNNKCLEYVSVSGYQIVRSLTIMFNIILTYVVLHDKTSFKACLACGGVVAGFFCGVEGEVGLSLKGAIYGVLSSLFVALYSIVVKKVMGLLDNNEYLLIEYNTPIAIIMLIPIVWYSGEFDVLQKNMSSRFWGMQTLAGVVGFIINIAIFLNIKYTTPLTHNLSGTVKACLQTLLAFVVFPGSEIMTPMKFLGTILVIGFSAYYAYVRKSEMKQRIENKQTEQQKDDLKPLYDVNDENGPEDFEQVIEEEEK